MLTGDSTNTPLGTTGAGTIVSNLATLDLAGYTLGTAEALTINGSGVSDGALINSGGNATYSGLLTLGSASRIVGGSGTITLSHSGTITGSTFGLVLGGAQGGTINSIIGTGTGYVQKRGAGTWTLTGNNTYSGNTTFYDDSGLGTLAISNSNALGSSAVTVSSGGNFKSYWK